MEMVTAHLILGVEWLENFQATLDFLSSVSVLSGKGNSQLNVPFMECSVKATSKRMDVPDTDVSKSALISADQLQHT